MESKFNCTPKPAMLRSVQAEKWSVTGAIAELVDNAFGKGRGNADHVTIYHDVSWRTLKILDGGNGMDAIGRLFQHGNSIGYCIDDIGIYGAGGTKALLWLASSAEVSTLSGGKIQSDSVAWNDWFSLKSFEDANVSNEWHRATSANTSAELLELKHGTEIRLQLLPARAFRVTSTLHDLARMYSPGLRKGKRITWITSRKGKPEGEFRLTDPFLDVPADAKIINFDLVIEYDSKHLPVHGLVSYHDTTPQTESRVHIGLGHRIIQSTNDCYHSQDGEERYVGIGVSGWLDLGDGWQPYLTTTKDGINNSPLYRALMNHVFEAIKHILKQSEKKSFNILFDDLAIGLSHALNSRMQGVEMDAGEVWKPLSSLGGGGGIDGPAPGPVEKPNAPETPSPGGPGHKEKKKTMPPLEIEIIPQTDQVMKGVLCRADIQSDALALAINEDHVFVKEALKARPPNRWALRLLVTEEIARSIAADGPLVKKIFPPRLATPILEIEAAEERARIISRRLMDAVRMDVKGDVADAA
jgi:hypothetical protein